ncbi:MAG TPA: hypothetical protein VGH74_09820 [Planctomycetaceae bacterium]
MSTTSLIASTTAPATARAKATPTTDWWRIARHATVALIGVFFLTTLREGHSWGDDFAQYLRHADNIAHAAPYAETGYIYNPQNAIVGPKAYPPGYSTALAPVAAVYGANLAAYKAMGILLFLIALLVIARLFSHDLSAPNLWICLTILGLSPIFWEVKDFIMSEHLFIPLWYAALLTADDWYRGRRIYGNKTLHGVILGALISATCATRTAGIVLLPVVVVCEALIARRATRVGVVALATAISLLAAERLVLPSSGAGYLEQLKGISVSQLLANAYADTTSFSLIWQNRHWEGLRKIAGVVFALLAAIGFIRSNFSRPTPLGIATAGYFVLVVVWPSADGLRMILPLVPAFVFYVLVGMTSARCHRRRTTFPGRHGGWLHMWTRRADLEGGPTRSGALTPLNGSLALLLFSLCSFGAAYSAADFGPLMSGIESPAAKELFEFVRTHTDPADVCLFFKPRALALYTGRHSSAYPLGTDEHELWRYAKSIGAKFIIVRNNAAQRTDEDQTCEMSTPFAACDIEEVFHNSMFRVYRRQLPTDTGQWPAAGGHSSSGDGAQHREVEATGGR